ncbi:recombinase family protein [Janthinobacterium sp. TND4EL3]|uniref:recombinase family protein n=1 Tax=Janthinobacterium sp. TND4EL3 TaxID=1907311 RepID=UPI00097134DA|nr:recombinase family protein [Janthinobacterium sp. TND4EL3]
MTNLAYSYIRFSHSSQRHGGSLERQDTTAAEYAARKGLTLDTELDMRDLGKSGFTGKNITDGALGKFVKAVEDGTVPVGSFLLIEDIDRLSRLPVMEALAVFQSIIKGGVTVVTLKDGKEYSSASLLDDWVPLMPILVSMGRANEESKRKSTLLSSAWKRKKEAAAAELLPMGNNAPQWLEYVKEDTAHGINAYYRAIPERAAIVQRIFQLSIDGRGRTSIAAILNAENTLAFKGGLWGTTQISRILKSRAVLGEYQPRTMRKTTGHPPVIGYFPAVIDEATFNEAAAKNTSRRIHGLKKTTRDFNVWAGIGKCAACGESMYSITKGKLPEVGRIYSAGEKKPPPVYTYLTCSGKRAGCKAKAIRIEKTELIYREILAKVGDKSLFEDKAAIQASNLEAAQGKLMTEEGKLAKMAEGLEEAYSLTLAKELNKQEGKIDNLKEEIASLKLSLAADTIDDKAAFFAAFDLTNRDLRQKSNELLKRLNIIVKIDGGASHYSVEQDKAKILDIFDSKEPGITFFPATPATSNAVWDQEGNFSPSFDPDPNYEEDDYASEGDYGDSRNTN